MKEEVKKISTPGPMTFCCARKINSYLIRAKLYPPEISISSFRCKCKHCQVCLNAKETDFFLSSITNKTDKINDTCSCNSKCFIFLLTCQKS